MYGAQIWQRNLVLLNAISFARTFLIIMPIFVPLMQSYGLSMKETMLLQSVFAATTLLLEIPSGFLADVFGRKNTLMIGYFLAGAGFSQIVWADSFLELAIFEVTLGFAMSMVSGSDTALAFESEKAMNIDQAQPAIARLLSWMNFGEGVAAITAFVLVKFDVRWVLWVQAIVGWVPFILGMWLVEPPKIRTQTQRKNTRDAIDVIRQTPILIFFTGIFVVTMSTTYLVAWLNQNLWQANQLPLEYFGLVWGLFSMTVGMAARFSTQLPDRIGAFGQFSVMAAVLLVSYLALNSHLLWVIIFGGLVLSVFRGFVAPKLKIRINNSIGNDYRATVNSLVASSFRVTTLFLGPLMGMVVDRFGANVAAAALIALVLPAMVGLVLLDIRHKTDKADVMVS